MDEASEERSYTLLESSGSGGSIFLIIFFVGFFVYFVAGIIYKKKRYDAQGVDMVPNIDFWKELPFLVKDGVAYTIDKIRGLFNK